MVVINRKQILALFLGIFTTLFPHTNNSNQKQKVTTVFFDIGRVLVKSEFSYRDTIDQLGMVPLLQYMIFDRKNPFNLKHKTKEVVAYMLEHEGTESYNSRSAIIAGISMPLSFIKWQKGEISSNDMLIITAQAIESMDQDGYFCSEREKKLVSKLIRTTFIATEAIKSKRRMKKITELVPLLHAQKNSDGTRKYKLIILSNIETEHYLPAVQRRFPELFELFDDIIASGDINIIKPDTRFYQYALYKHNLRPDECIFLDDRIENLEGAKDVGINGIMVDLKNLSTVREQLEQLEILPAPAMNEL